MDSRERRAFELHIISLVEDSAEQRVQKVDWHNQIYWLKQLEKPKGKDKLLKPRSKKRFEQEKHNLITLHKMGAPVPHLVFSGEQFLVLEDVGITLNDVLSNEKYSLAERRSIACQAAAALAELHKNQLVHGRPAMRDIAYKAGKLCFIDFEYNLESHNITWGKTRDFLIFMHDVCRNHNKKIIPAAWIPLIISAYRSNDGDETWQNSRAFMRKFRWLKRLLLRIKPSARSDLLAAYQLFDLLDDDSKII